MTLPLITPTPLERGDRIVFLSPAGIARRENVETATGILTNHGFRVGLMPHALGLSGSFSGTREERLADITEALLDDEVKAIICTRGGYGAVHLLDALDRLPLRDHPKWLVGFSDICALHALMARHRIASIHGPMAKHISARGGDNPDFETLLRLLTTPAPSIDYTFAPHPLNRFGSAEATLAGGNLAVLQALISTPFDMIRPGTILFIEDIAEPIYKIERMLWQLRLSGVLPRLAGLITGRFTGADPDRNHPSVESMIRHMVEDYSYPVAFDLPIGHGPDCRPLILSAPARITITPEGTRLWQITPQQFGSSRKKL